MDSVSPLGNTIVANTSSLFTVSFVAVSLVDNVLCGFRLFPASGMPLLPSSKEGSCFDFIAESGALCGAGRLLDWLSIVSDYR